MKASCGIFRVPERGFTLLEVLIALAIVALALVALIRTAGLSADALARERNITYAHWVANNVIADMHLANRPPDSGQSRGSMYMGDRQWHWRATAQTTEEPTIARVDVQVYEDEALSRPLALVTAFIGSSG